MTMTAKTTRHTVTCALIGAALAWASPAFGQYGAADGEWRFYAGMVGTRSTRRWIRSISRT